MDEKEAFEKGRDLYHKFKAQFQKDPSIPIHIVSKQEASRACHTNMLSPDLQSQSLNRKEKWIGKCMEGAQSEYEKEKE